jgi:disulfide oxidoreductase YuzD
LSKRPVRIIIINDPLNNQDCDASCGTDWSSLQSLELARKQIRERFEGDIRLTYLDITQDSAGDDVKRWMEEIKKKNLSVPLLIINGHLRISGNFDIRQMMDVIEVESELGV